MVEVVEDIKLNIGSGERHLPGFLSVDSRIECHGVNIVHDLRKPLPFKEDTVSVIFASHIIEHFWWQEVNSRLKDWFRVLKLGGYADIWTPDFEIVMKRYQEEEDFEDEHYDKMEWVNRIIFSRDNMDGIVNAVNEHHAIFDYLYLKQCMESVGFTDVERIDIKEFPFKGIHADMNMGVRGYKRQK